MPSREWPVLCVIYMDSGRAFHVLQGQLLGHLGLLSGAVILEWPWSSVGGQCQQSEQVSRVWVNSREP